ncbi:response regulator transcription factor [Chloroflexi bacterium TSY]|nr:response regulator transcription factor [Chloroflexi bacterium TSY]
MTIRLLVVDDQALFRDGLCRLLNAQPDFTVIGEAANGQEAVEQARRLQPKVVLMDLRMPVMDGVRATQQIVDAALGSKVIALTTFDDDELVFDCLRAGAVSYLLKATSPDELTSAIRRVASGESILDPGVTTKVVAEFTRLANQMPRLQPLPEPLSGRELEVLRLVTRGFTNKEIAEALVIAEGTVRNHVTTILAKLGVTARTQAAVKAKELGLV